MTTDPSNNLPSIGREIRGTFRAFETILTRELNLLGIRYSHFQILSILWEGDGLTQRQVAEASFITQSTLAQSLNEMVSEGLVERKRAETDGRKRHIILTTKGRNLQKLVKPLLSDFKAATLQGLSQEDAKVFINLIIKIRNNISETYNLRQDHAKNIA